MTTYSVYQITKDFASPVATIIAAAAATYITQRLGRMQLTIAQSQRDIAFDRLKYDLFEQRYTIYTTAKKLIETICGNEQGINDRKVRNMRTKIDEARFFFPAGETKIFSRIELLAGEYMAAHRELYTAVNNGVREQAEQQVVEKLDALTGIYKTLPSDMEAALGFSQLTRRG